MKLFRLTLSSTLAAALMIGVVQQSHAAEHAAKVMYAFGQVAATPDGGRGRSLRKGDPVYPGETVSTARGRVQIRFTDGGFASLQPNTQYRVDEYNYSGRADGNERSFLSLIKGSVRLVTGVIGKRKRNSFRLKTRLATIGIRGTSGKASHCDSDCGDMPVGTRLQGYGGEWDLVSGSFSGPVAAGDAYICDGSTCRQMQGGVAQRRDVEGFDFEEENESDYVQGNQVDEEGRICDGGGNCGDTVVLLDQVGAGAFQGSPGDVETIDGLAVVLKGGVPIAAVAVDTDFVDGLENTDEDIGILTNDVDSLRSALNAFPDSDVRTIGNEILDAVDSETLHALREMPAYIALDDFGLTSDGLLTKGRWTDGYLLEINAFDEGATIETALIELRDYQSEHFIYGSAAVIPGAGVGEYHFTGGTFSTATDGSSIGSGATDGRLSWDFGLGLGSIDMMVEHGNLLFDVQGGLLGDERHFFVDDEVSAFMGEGAYAVKIEGFFAGPQSTNGAPRAAGLGYAIDMFSTSGYDIIGVAGFGLESYDSEGTLVAAPPPVPPVPPMPPMPPMPPTAPAATGTYVAAAHAFIDNFGSMGTNSNGWDFIVGAGNTAALSGNSVAAFNATVTGHALCSPACTFDAGTATSVESGTMATIGASWVRWGVGHAFMHTDIQSELGHAHVIKLDAPSSPIPTGGTGNYTVDGGGTTPTWNFGPGGATFEAATTWSHALNVNFGTGAQSATHNITFPSGTVTVSGTTIATVNTTNAINYVGDVSGAAGSCTSCVFGHDHYTFGGANAKYVVGSGQFNSSGLSNNVGGGFTFILGDPAR